MATRRRIALYFDLAFEPDRRLFARLAPYLRRKRANEIVKAALWVWLERQEALQQGSVDAPPRKRAESRLDEFTPGDEPGVAAEASGGVRELVERFAAEQAIAPVASEPDRPAAESTAPASQAPTAVRPRLGRLM